MSFNTVNSFSPSFSVTPFVVRLEKVIEAMKTGLPVILTDDFDRENEADLVIAAEKITEKTMAFMIEKCSGIVCLCITAEISNRLQLSPMVLNNESRHGTAFMVSIDAKEGITTGVSAADRVKTIQVAISQKAKPSDVVRPGHIFPIEAKSNGVLMRRGHTEGAIDLARLSELKPAAVLCELMHSNGTMMRGLEVEIFADRYGFPVLSVDELVHYRKTLGDE